MVDEESSKPSDLQGDPGASSEISPSELLEDFQVPQNLLNSLPCIRILSLHLIGYLYKNEEDYIFMINFLRSFLDWVEEQGALKGNDADTISELDATLSEQDPLKHAPTPNLSLDFEAHDIPLKPDTPPQPTIENSEKIDTIIEECLESEIPDHEMAEKLDEIDLEEASNTVSEIESEKPVFLWQFSFDPDEYNLSDFISPITTGNSGSFVKCMLRYTMSTKVVDARIRTFITAVSHVIQIDYEVFKAYEILEVENVTAIEEYKKKKTKMSKKRMAAIGLSAVGGAALLGLTGGLAAPLIASGLTGLIGSSAVFLGTTAGIATITTFFGAVGGGLGAYKMNKLVGSIKEFEFVKLTKESSVAITIVLNGLYSEECQLEAWTELDYTKEQYILNYETKYIQGFTDALSEFLASVAVTLAAEEIVKYTILAALAASLAWPSTMISFLSVIDNPWTTCMKRSKAVGRHLATVLVSRLQGNRPITLVGYGFGARVIFFCLLYMVTKHEPDEYAGIIENAVLCGTPVTSQPLIWEKVCLAVSGKCVNAFSTKDWVLSFLYKTTSVTKGIAGVSPIELDDRKMVNIDLTSIVAGHSDYQTKMGQILKLVGMAKQD